MSLLESWKWYYFCCLKIIRNPVDLMKRNHRPWGQCINNHLPYSYTKHEMNAGGNVHLDLEIQ